MGTEKSLYRVVFINQDQVYELYVRHVFQSEMWGFLQLEDFVFGSRSELLVDPSEEKLRQQFDGVTRTFVPMQAIIRIDEVKKEGPAKMTDAKGVVARFPVMPPKQK